MQPHAATVPMVECMVTVGSICRPPLDSTLCAVYKACDYVCACSSTEGKRGVRWPGLSAPLPKTSYGPDWFAKDLEMKVVEEDDDEVKWSGARISSDLPGR